MTTQNSRNTSVSARLLSTTALTAASLVVMAIPAQAGSGPVGDNDVMILEHTAPFEQSEGYVSYKGNRIVDNAIQEDIGINGHTHFDARQAIITGVEPGQMKILGKLSATGDLYLLDVDGFLFGQGSVVDTAGSFGAFAGTVNPDDILDGDGKFDVQTAEGAEINIEAGARITVADAGIAAFVAPTIRNAGIINAKMGKVAFAAGDKVTLDLYGDDLVEIAVDGKLADALIEHTGEINAAGGVVKMTAAAAKDAVDNIINVKGLVTVASATQQGGKIILSGGNQGAVNVEGTLDASGKTGGDIDVTGQNINLAGTAELHADGGLGSDNQGGGGRIYIYGDNAAIVRSQITARGGEQGGKGGFIETSATDWIDIDADVDASAAAGWEAGTWLIDPRNLAIVDSLSNSNWSGDGSNGSPFSPTSSGLTSRLNVSNITNSLNAGTDVYISTVGAPGSGDGNIFINTTIHKTGGGDATLTMNAEGSITTSLLGSYDTFDGQQHVIYADDAAGKLNVDLTAGGDISLGGLLQDDRAVNTNGGSFTAHAGNNYEVWSDIITEGGDVNINATNNIGLYEDVLTGGGKASFTAGNTFYSLTAGNDVDTAGGDIAVTAAAITTNSALNSGNGNIYLETDAATLNGAVNAGTGNVDIVRHTAGTITVGDVINPAFATDLHLDASELSNITASQLTIGRGDATSKTTNMMVGSFDTTGSINEVVLNAMESEANIGFYGNALSNNLVVNADDDIWVSNNATSGIGNISATGDITMIANDSLVGDAPYAFWIQGNISANNVNLQTSGAISQDAANVITANTLTGSVASTAYFDGTNNITNVGDFATGTAGWSNGGFRLNNVSGAKLKVVGAVSSDGGDIAIVNNNRLDIGSTGSVTSGGGNITLTADGNNFLYIDGSVDSGAGATALSASHTVLRNGSTVSAGSLDVAGKDVDQDTGSTITAGLLTGTLTKTANFAGTNNDIGTLGAFSTGVSGTYDGGFNLYDVNGFDVAGAVSTQGGDITLTTGSSAWNQSVDILAAGSLVSNGGNISIDTNGASGGFTTVAGSINAGTGDVDVNARQFKLTGTSTVTGDQLNVTGGSVTQTANSIITANTLTGSVASTAYFDGANNITNVGDFATGTAGWSNGGFRLVDNGGLTVSGTISTSGTAADPAHGDGSVSITTTGGDLNFTGTSGVSTNGGAFAAKSDTLVDFDLGSQILLGSGAAHIDAPQVNLGADINTTGEVTGTASLVNVENDTASIQDGVDVARDVGGAIVNVADGTYAENVTIDKSLTLKGNQAGTDARTGRAGADESILNGYIITGSNIDGLTIDGFTINNQGDTVLGYGGKGSINLGNNVSNVTITNTIFDGQDAGGFVYQSGIVTSSAGASNVLIKNNLFTNEQYGIYVNRNDVNVDITDNTFDANKYGVVIQDGGAGTDISGNTFQNSVGSGIYVWNANGYTSTIGTLEDNFFRDNGQHISYLDATAPDLSVEGSTGNKFYINGAYKLASDMTVDELFALEDSITHKVDDAAYGLIIFKDGDLFVTQNTAGIQNAINIADAYDTIHVDGSTYTEDLLINKALKLKGYGTTLQSNGGAKLITVTADDVNIDPFVFDGGGSASYGIYADGANNLIIDGNTFLNFLGDAINIQNSNDIQVFGNIIYNTGNDGIAVIGGTGAHITDNYVGYTNAGVTPGAADNIGRHGIYVQGNGSAVISGNKVTETGVNGIYAYQSADADILNNLVSNVGANGAGVAVNDGINAEVRGNIISGAQEDGIWVVGGSNNTVIDDNTISGSTRNGITVGSSTNVDITDNDVSSFGVNGISVSGASNGAEILANTISNSGSGIGIRVEGSSDVQIGDDDVTTITYTKFCLFGKCIDIPSGVSVDENGNDINDVETGIYISGGSNNDVVNNDATSVDYGIVLSGTTNAEVRDNDLNGNSLIGIQVLAGSNGANVHDNVLNHFDTGIVIDNSSDVTIDDNTLTDVLDGIVADGTNGLTVIDNGITGRGAAGTGVKVTNSDDVKIGDYNVVDLILFTALNDKGNDIAGFATGVDADNVTNLSIVLNNIDGDNTGTGIRVTNSNGAQIGGSAAGSLLGLPLTYNLGNDVEDFGTGIYVSGSDDVNVEYNTVHNISGDGVYVLGGDRAYIYENDITDVDGDGIDVNDNDDVRIHNNTIDNTGDHGINVAYSNGSTIDGNTIDTTGGNGVKLTDSDYVTISANTVDNAGENGIFVDPSSFVDVVGNTVNFAVQNGILVLGGTNNTATGNTVLGSGWNGIAFDGSDNFYIFDNTSSNNGEDGILVDGSNNGTVSGNTANLNLDDGIEVRNATNIGIINNTANNNTAGLRLVSVDGIEALSNGFGFNSQYGVLVEGPDNGLVSVLNNVINASPVGARFESGVINLSVLGLPNIIIGTGGTIGLQFDEVGVPGSLSLDGNTIGATTFSGFLPVGSFYVRFEDGTLLDTVTGAPIVINGLNANFDGLIPASQGGFLTPAQLEFLESRIYDADDSLLNGRGQLFVGTIPTADQLGLDDVEDFFNRYGTPGDGSSGFSVTVRGLPNVTAAGLNALTPAAGNAGPAGLNAITPAAGGDTAGVAPQDIEPEAGGEDVSCWSDAVSAGGTTTFNYGGSFEDSLAGAGKCSSGNI